MLCRWEVEEALGCQQLLAVWSRSGVGRAGADGGQNSMVSASDLVMLRGPEC